MASSSSTVAASTIVRPRIAIAVASAAVVASFGYYYYRHRYSSDELDHLDFSGPSLASDSHLHRRNALRRSRRPARLQDDSSSESHSEDHVDPTGFSALNDDTPDPNADSVPPIPIPVPLQGEQPDEWYNDSSQARQRTGENIVTLLFRVSEDNARRNAYVHRGCLCNGCGMLPIRGVRYRCANCPDFDLCEMCESQGSHNKAHVFYKVKIPVPFSAARQVQPPWYTGDPSNCMQNLPKHLLSRWSNETGFERVELDALWEQWTFMANTEWREDPSLLGLAMDRKTFERCLVPSAGHRHPAPNLVHDRMFAFYDTNNDGLIGFEEYLHGVSYRRRKDKLRRTFEGYDVDGDGYVSRRDFLRMFRAYYVSYKQMHRDTVEGLDDYMVTNVDVQQLVSGRQPLSSLFGRDQRIPDAEGNRMMEGKAYRSSGEVDITDGRGAVNEDKPDTATREDILRDLFTRRGNQGYFTESFGPSRATQSPARESRYWSGILDPPHNTVDLGALLSGDQTQLDNVLDSIRRRRASQPFVADDGETGSSDDDDDESTPDDRMDDDGDTNHTPHDENETLQVSNGLIDPAEFIRTLPTEIRIHHTTQGERLVSSQQLYTERQKRISTRNRLYERWKRRQFYLDEEEGSMPPQGWLEKQDILANLNQNLEPSKPAPPPLSPRSRSSSKVRFAEDTDDFETRSNHSTSSRSVPERWGGMEIPDAERDAGKEILYQITQQAFNELLDAVFKKKEDLALLAAETKKEREEYRHILDDFELQDDDERSLRYPLPTIPRRRSPSRQPAQQSLHELLSTSGYTVADPGVLSGVRSNDATGQGSRGNQRTSSQTPAPSSSDYSTPVTSEHPENRDPTMPQFMPDTAPSDVHDVSTQASDNEQDENIPPTTHNQRARTNPDTQSHIPRSTLVAWKLIDQAEQEAKERRGWGRLSYAEFEEIYREHELQDGSKNRLAYLGSWIEFCIPA
ncbi:putative ef hand domain-containing protein [Rosellinia necatrix]|uniref:Putative ef hand domain-containing protein n=1 Tax=Rosellinia necatrix TaxID=77044 RepID=A0A1W2TIT2_ROSNE|nr:putative ef hand domain-containing protein [Rosellinia necatrix]